MHDHQNGILPDAFNNFIKRNEDVQSQHQNLKKKNGGTNKQNFNIWHKICHYEVYFRLE